MSDSDLDVPDAEMREVKEGWNLAAAMLSDKQPDPPPQFPSQLCGLNSAVGDLSRVIH